MAERSKIVPWAVELGFLLMLPLFFMDWSGGGDYPQLEKAGRRQQAMAFQTAQNFLSPHI